MNTRGMLSIGLIACAMALASLVSACSDGDTPSGACVADNNCPAGTTCNEGICGKVECLNDSYCASTQVCAAVAGENICVAATCGCVDCAACPNGQDCVAGQCKPPTTTTCLTTTDCPGDLICVAGSCEVGTTEVCDPACTGTDVCDEATTTCRPCEGAECPAADCTVDGCDAGFTCNVDTKQCEEDVPVQGVACATCSTSADCGTGGWNCIPVGGDNICAPPCGTSDECDTGWTCFSGQCVPGGFSCTGCAADGCDSGQACETNAGGSCQAAKGDCDSCIYDWECGDGGACHDVGAGQKHCVPRCSSDTDCPASAECIVDTVSGYKVCSPLVNTCCLDDNVANCSGGDTCTPACDGSTPHCSPASVCVQCLFDEHCGTDETCDLTTGTCSGTTGCQAPTPHFSSEQGKCVQCLNDGHCGGGTCNLATNTCDGDVCSTCVDPYPACALVGGDYYCVQCTNDGECGQGGTCNLQTYSCEGGTITVPDACTQDSDCDPGITSFNLVCEPSSGLCIDADGGCDDITAYCPGGNECASFFESFIGGDIPIGDLPGAGGSTIPGVCTCQPDTELIPGLGGPSADCPDNGNCGPPLFELLTGMSSGKMFCSSLSF